MHSFYVAARSLAFMTAMLIAASTVDATQAKQVGMVISLKGEANVQRVDGTAERLKLTSAIFEKDTITTEFQAFVQIDFLDHSKVSIMGSSDLTIDEYVYDGTKASTSKVSIQNGALGFMAGKIKDVAPENYEVKTAFASVGIRGSSGELTTSDGSLPGVPPGLSLMKTGGEGLTVAASVPEMAPVGDITESGAGITVNSNSEVKTVTFAAPPTQTYTASTEKKVSSARQEVAKQEAAAKPTQTAQGEQEPTGEGQPAQAAAGEDNKTAPAGEQKQEAAAAVASQESAKAEASEKNEEQASIGDAPAVVPAEAAAEDTAPVEAPAEVNEPPPVIEIDNDDLSLAELQQEIQQENQEIQEEVADSIIPDPQPDPIVTEDEDESGFEFEDEAALAEESAFEDEGDSDFEHEGYSEFEDQYVREDEGYFEAEFEFEGEGAHEYEQWHEFEQAPFELEFDELGRHEGYKEDESFVFEHEGPGEYGQWHEFEQAPFEWEFEAEARHEGHKEDDRFEDLIHEAAEDFCVHHDFLDIDGNYHFYCDHFTEAEGDDCQLPLNDIDLWCHEPEDGFCGSNAAS